MFKDMANAPYLQYLDLPRLSGTRAKTWKLQHLDLPRLSGIKAKTS